MADSSHRPQHTHHGTSGGHTSTKSWLYATAAGAAFGGPFLGMSGLSSIAALTLLVITSPLLLIFSPLLLGTGLLVVGVMAAFGVAAVMGIAGVSSLAWLFRSIAKFITRGDTNDVNVTDVIGGVVDTAKESEEVKEVLIGNGEGGKEEGDSSVNIERDTDKETNKDRNVDVEGAAAAEKESDKKEVNEEGKDKEGGGDNAGFSVNVDRSAEKDKEGKDKEGDANVDVDTAAEKEADSEEADGDKITEMTENKDGTGKETKRKKKGRDKTSNK